MPPSDEQSPSTPISPAPSVTSLTSITYDLHPNADHGHPDFDPPPYTFHPNLPFPSFVPALQRLASNPRTFFIPLGSIAAITAATGGGGKLILSRANKRDGSSKFMAPQLYTLSNVPLTTFLETFCPNFVTLYLAPGQSTMRPWIAVNPAAVVEMVPHEKMADTTMVTIVIEDDRRKQYQVYEKIAKLYRLMDPEGWQRSIQLTQFMATLDLGGGNLLTDAME
ncbi:hypothetical protein HK097_006323 [Rhizophlyctis rosea]|uniref:Uncharacterized protein n=1 Tax=Rhizophlyctis rosea TaxID=64517 RepID=A0AAD5SEF4_9FUNG|nr:hypothetical protein HK097_006323 [Rhizophlyctis rosea]